MAYDVSAITNAGQGVQSPLGMAQAASTLNNSVLSGVGQGIANRQAQSNLNQDFNSQLARASLAQVNDPDQSPAAYRAAVDRMTAINPGLQGIANTWKSELTDDKTPEQLKELATRHAAALLDPVVQAQQGPNGQITFVNNGATQIPVVTPGGLSRMGGNTTPRTAGGAPIGAIRNDLSPEAAATRVTGSPNPDGSPATEPLGSQTPGYGGAAIIPPGGSAGGGSNLPPRTAATPRTGGPSAANPPPINGMPGANGPTPAPGSTPPGGTTPGTPGRVTTGMPANAETSRQMGNQLVAASQGVTQNKTDYNNMLTELEGMRTGPGTFDQAKVGAFLSKWAGNPALSGLDASQLSKQEGFNKLVQQISNRQAQALSGSNQSQISALSATPNPNLSTPGNTQIIHKLQGNEDMVAGKAAAWNAWQDKHGYSSYPQFSEWWNNNLDTRSFQVPYFGAEEKGDLLKSFNAHTPQGKRQGDDFLKRNNTYQNAQNNGWGSVIP